MFPRWDQRPIGSRLHCRFLLATTLIAASGIFFSAHAAELPAFPNGQTLPPAESWRYGRIDDFEILSQLGDTSTRKQVRDIAAVRQMVNFATGFDDRYSQPCLLIFHRDKAAYLSFLPATDTVLAERTSRPTAVNARKFLRGTEQTALVHFGDIYQNAYSGGAAIVHNIFQQIAPRPPVWFRVGVGNLIRVTDPDAAWDPQKFFTLSIKILPPFAELVSAPLPASEALTLNPDPLWESPFATFHHYATLFVHYGLLAEGGIHRDKMIAYVRLAAEQPVDETDFIACFGIGYEDMRVRLREYMASPALRSFSLRSQRKEHLAALRAPELRPASQAEIARILGEARIMAGYNGDAHRDFLHAYLRGERDPQLLGSLGISESLTGDKARALPLLEAAVAARVPRPMVYLQFARLRYPGLREAADTAGRVTRAQAAPLLDALQQARSLKPPLAEVYQCLAVTFAMLADPLTPGELAALDEAVQLFPRDTELIFAGAKIKRDQGDVAGAARLIKLGVSAANSDHTRAKFERLRATIGARTDPH